MKKTLLLMISGLLLTASAWAQYPVKSVYETQYQTPENLAALKDFSPLIKTKNANGIPTDQTDYSDTITVVAVVLEAPYQADGKRTYYSSSSPTIVRFNVADTSFLRTKTYDWNCINVSTNLDSSFTPKDPLKLGQLQKGMVVKLTGRVREFLKSTQFELLSGRKEGGLTVYTNIVEVIDEVDPDLIPSPKRVDIGTFNKGTWANNVTSTQQLVTGEKLESAPVTFSNLSVTGLIKTNGESEIFIQDSFSNVFAVDNQANRFRADQGLWPSGKGIAPVGSRLDSISGYIGTYNGNGMYGINPINSSWVYVAANVPPTISTWKKSKKYYSPSEGVTINFSAGDADGTISSVELFYRTSVSASFTKVFPAKGTGNEYSQVIPAVNQDSAFVEFYIEATDNLSGKSRQPINENYAYWVLSKSPTIQAIQFSRKGDTESYFKGDTLTVTGIVTSTRQDIGDVYIQNGSGPWSGIQIFGARSDTFKLGDKIELTATVDEFSGKTELKYTKVTDFKILARKQPVPPATLVPTDSIRNGGPWAEAYEGVLVKLANVFVVNTNSNIAIDGKSRGEFLVSEKDGSPFGLAVDDKANRTNHILPYLNTLNLDYTLTKADSAKTLLVLGQKFESLTGIIDAFFLSYYLEPRDSADFGLHSGVNVAEGTPATFKLLQNYPNPFNPSTTIEFSLPVSQKVTLSVYNLIGQKVATLINSQMMQASTHRISFDASNLASGVYFYQLRAGNNSIITKKMMLIK